MNIQLKTHSDRLMPLPTSLIAAGNSAVFIGDDYQMLDVNSLITGNREGFVAFEVTGNSMLDHIRPGNIIFVDTYAQPKNGDVIAANHQDLTCVKVFQNSPKGLYLVSTNSKYAPSRVTASDSFTVLGVVRGHLELYS